MIKSFLTENINELIAKALYFASRYDYFVYLNPNNHNALHGGFPHILAIGAKDSCSASSDSWEKLSQKLKHDNWFGFLGYDLKNFFHQDLDSNNPSTITTDDFFFFKPEIIIRFHQKEISVQATDADKTLFEIQRETVKAVASTSDSLDWKALISKHDYVQNVNFIKDLIREGEFYEMNYCQSYEASGQIEPVESYLRLNHQSPMPFSSLMKIKNQWVICASPERFLKRTRAQLIAQPIKGTIKSSGDPEEDECLKLALKNSEKEKAENLMIVDLMRNDLSQSCIPGSIKVDELWGIYTYGNLHQMISTVSGSIKEGSDNLEIIKKAFPMGSMTGAPKRRVMEWIEKLENFKRGIFSGSIGYFHQNGDFDFNVVIRSVFYDETMGKLYYAVGSAITLDSDANQEYEECLLKAEMIKKVIS